MEVVWLWLDGGLWRMIFVWGSANAKNPGLCRSWFYLLRTASSSVEPSHRPTYILTCSPPHPHYSVQRNLCTLTSTRDPGEQAT